jgi:type IV secretion system protein VirD4
MSVTEIAAQAAPVVALLAAATAWRYRACALATLLAAVTALLAGALIYDPRLGWAAPVVLLAGAGAGLAQRARTASTVNRWGTRARNKSGVASTLDVLRVGSAWAMRRKATVVRPSLGELSRWRRALLRTTEVAVPLARVGRQRVWASVEDVILTFGSTRSGKSVWLTGRIIDAPGATVVTSTRTDLHDVSAGLRTKRGPVYLFNTPGLADMQSTISFDPLTGCREPVAAAERATDLLAASSHGDDGDRAFWTAQAQRVLAALMHAAALGGLSMHTVLEWVSDPASAQREVTSLLRRSPEPAFVEAATQFLVMARDNPRTGTSITSTIMPALSWLTSPAACAAATGAHPFDVGELLRSRATVYLLAEPAETDVLAAPLITALTGYIAREARRIAARQPGGRLDPPLTLALDEARLISPVPLPSWTSDMGGRGITIIAAFQSRAQVIDRWGATGAASILSNAGSVIAFGGGKDHDELQHWSALAGERDETVETRDDSGRVTSRSTRKTPVISAAQLGNLPAWRVVIYRRGMLPVIGRVSRTWKRRDVRAQARVDKRAERTLRAAADNAAPEDAAFGPGDTAPTEPPTAPTAPGRAGDRAPGWETDREGTTREVGHDGR